MPFKRIFDYLTQLDCFYFQVGETKRQFIWRVFKKTIGPILLILSIIYLVFNGYGNNNSYLNFCSIGICIIFCSQKMFKILLSYIMAFFQIRRLTQVVNQEAPTGIYENLLTAINMEQRETIFRKVYKDRYAGPRDKSMIIIRQWMSCEVVQPLVDLIIESEMALLSAGLTFGRIGEIPLRKLETLERMNKPIEMYCPRYVFLLNFLQFSSNQKYLVYRFNQLAQGNFLANYIPFSPDIKKYPLIDSCILFYCFSIYMDEYLTYFYKDRPRMRPFRDHVVIKDLKRIKFKKGVGIYCPDWLTPSYQLIRIDDHEEIIEDEVNDVFEIITDFFYVIKHQFRGYLLNFDVNHLCAKFLGQIPL